MPSADRAEPIEGTTDEPPPDVMLFKSEQIPQTIYVDSFGWRCCVCGHVGTGLLSMESAQKESFDHMRKEHAEMEAVNVTVLTR